MVLLLPFSVLLISPPNSSFPRALQLHIDRLDLRVEVDRVAAQFTAEARLLIAAEWRERIDDSVAIYPYRARLERACDLVCATYVARPHARRQSIGRVVTLEHSVVFVLERNQDGDRSKDLLTGYPHSVFGAGVDRRFHKITLRLRATLSPGFRLCTLLARQFEVAEHARVLFA